MIEFLRLHVRALARFEIGRSCGRPSLELRAQAIHEREAARRRCRRGSIHAHEARLDADRQQKERYAIRMELGKPVADGDASRIVGARPRSSAMISPWITAASPGRGGRRGRGSAAGCSHVRRRLSPGAGGRVAGLAVPSRTMWLATIAMAFGDCVGKVRCTQLRSFQLEGPARRWRSHPDRSWARPDAP